MDRLQQVLSQGVVVDKVEAEEEEEEVPSLDPISGDRVSALAKLLACVLFWCGYLFLGVISLNVNVCHAVLP